MEYETKEIKIEDLIPFYCHSGLTYQGERLQQLMDSIEHAGLISPIIVRPVSNGKYEIVCGHNRAEAAKALGYHTIRADIRHNLPDDIALELFFDSNLNQQSFSDWKYSQKFAAIKYCEEVLKITSKQGKRTDLETEPHADTKDGTCVQNGQKLESNSRKTTSRDKMARKLGMSTATLSKYRRIVKLPDDLLQSIARLLDEKRITFEAAYIISGLRDYEMKYLIEGIKQCPNKILDINKLKKLCRKNDENQVQ